MLKLKDIWFKKQLSQEEQFALVGAGIGIDHRILSSYRQALSQIAEQYAQELGQLVERFGLENLLTEFRTRRLGRTRRNMLPRELVEAIRHHFHCIL